MANASSDIKIAEGSSQNSRVAALHTVVLVEDSGLRSLRLEAGEGEESVDDNGDRDDAEHGLLEGGGLEGALGGGRHGLVGIAGAEKSF